MKTRRLHVVGAPGAGHHDTDDYFWRPSNPPYRETRPVEERLRLMAEMFLELPDWVLSGSLEGWGETLLPCLDAVAFLTVPTSVRLARLRDRETRRFGAAVAPGAWRHQEYEAFIEWASHYDDGTREGRSQPRHEAWLARLACPVLRLDGMRPRSDLVAEVVAALPASG